MRLGCQTKQYTPYYYVCMSKIRAKFNISTWNYASIYFMESNRKYNTVALQISFELGDKLSCIENKGKKLCYLLYLRWKQIFLLC